MPTSLASRWAARSNAVAVAIILLLTLLVYLPALHGGLLWDDDAHITRPEMQSLHGLYRIWFEPGATQQYYPLLHSVFWLEHELWRDSVLGYHLVNLLWHLVAVWLVYRILERLKIPGALLATAIFALHPVMVESVAWITEQKNTLSAVFYLSAMLVYLKFDVSRGRSAYFLALVLFVLGLLTKTVTATLPAALLVIFWWQRSTISLKRDVAPLVPFFALGAVAGVLTAWIERTQIGAQGADFELNWLQRGLLAGRVIWFYVAKLLWPANLIFIYPRWLIDPTVWWQWLFPIATLITFALLWAIRRKWRGPLAGWLLFCGTLFPVLGFLNVYPFIFSFVADHFQYLASLGIIVLASAAIAVGLNRLPQTAKRLGICSCVLLVALLAALTVRQSSMYGDSLALYERTIARNPTCWMAHNNLGAALYDKGTNSDAIEHYRAALRSRPDYFEAHKNLGIALTKQEAHDEASAQFAAALRLQPRDFDSLTNWGTTLLKTGRDREAIAAFREAVQLQPESWSASNNLGLALFQAHSYDEAIVCFEHALQLNPQALLVYNDLADAQAHTNQQQKAVSTLQHGLELANARGDKALMGNFRIRLKVIQNPNDPDVLKNFGIQLARAGHLAEGVEKLQAALALKPDDVTILNALGIALMRLDHAPQAIEYLNKAIRLKPDEAYLHSSLGQALSNAKDLPAAIHEFQVAVTLNPKSIVAHTELGIALAKAGRYPESIEHFERALQLQPSFNEARVNLAMALASSGKKAQALQQFQMAIESNPNDAFARYNFGNFLAHTDDIEQAIPQFEQAIRLQPASSDSHQSLGDALWQIGRKEEAIEHYQAALRHKPSFVQLYAKLAKMLAAMQRREEAIATAHEAIELARSSGQLTVARQIEEWLTNFQAETAGNRNEAVNQ